jgi:hypothetical protein
MNALNKNLRNIAIVAVFVLGSVQPALAGSFSTGQQLINHLRSESVSEQIAGAGYISGVYDGFGYGIIVGHAQAGKTKKEHDFLLNKFLCDEAGINLEQLTVIVKRYLENHPEKWNAPASTLVIEAMREAWPCKEGAK